MENDSEEAKQRVKKELEEKMKSELDLQMREAEKIFEDKRAELTKAEEEKRNALETAAKSQKGVMMYYQDVSQTEIDRVKQREFQLIFNLDAEETLIAWYSCSRSVGALLIIGTMYISQRAIYFVPTLIMEKMGHKKDILAFNEIKAIIRAVTLRAIQNAISINTRKEMFYYASFVNREQTFDLINSLWEGQGGGELVLKQGFLTKQGALVKNWKRRWCTLSDVQLTYKDPHLRQAGPILGSIKAHEIIKVDTMSSIGKKFCFSVEATWRTFYFCADTEAEMKLWISSFTDMLEQFRVEELKKTESQNGTQNKA